jgi:hypothetical protein
LLTDTFDTGALYFWTPGAGWDLIDSEGGKALSTKGGDEPVTFVHNTLTDLAVQVRVRFEAGMFRLSLRQSEAGAYTALLSAEGQVALYRGTTALASAVVAPNQPGQWRMLRLSAIGNLLRVQVDGAEVIAAQDAAPLPQGTFSFAGVGASGGVVVDDVVVEWVAPIATPTTIPVLIPTMTPSPFTSSAMNGPERLSGNMVALSIQNCASAGIVFKYVSDVPGLLSAVAEGSVLGQTRCYVIMMQPGIYNLTTVVSDFSFMPFKDGNVTLIGIDSYRLGTHPSALPDTSRVIIQRDINAPQSDLGLVQTGATVTFYNVILRNGGGLSRWAGGGLVNRGTLNLYNSVVQDNTALGYGGGLYNEGSAHIVNTIFQNNRISFAGTGGGAITNDDGTVLAECVIFNGNQAVGAGGAIYNFGTGNMTFNQAGFINNLTSNPQGKAINSAATTNLNGTINWQPTSDPVTVQFTGTGYIPAISSLTNGSPVNLNCSVPAILNPAAAGSRTVHANAAAFHAQAQQFGLPMPFDRLPYNPIQTGQRSADDPLQINSTPVPLQGFGPSTISYIRPTYYTETFGIHSGIDYGDGTNWVNRVVVSICDGVIVRGNWYQGGTNTGGSAQPGTGVSVRCFLDKLDSGRSDTNGDGKPELSNIIVTYNHLLPDPPQELNRIIDCSLVDIPGCSGGYSLPRPIFLDSDINSPCTDITQCVGDVVLTGEVLGQTTLAFDFDHLHLATFLARGYFRPAGANNAFYLNPLLLYTSQVVAQHRFSTYFPTQRDGSQVSDNLGIDRADLSEWSAGGWNFYPNGNLPNNTFWQKQNPATPGPGHVEWPNDNYPNIPANNPIAITDLIEYLTQSFNSYPYVAPSCVIFSDESRTPLRLRARCDQSDTRGTGDDVYNVVPHPGN